MKDAAPWNIEGGGNLAKFIEKRVIGRWSLVVKGRLQVVSR